MNSIVKYFSSEIFYYSLSFYRLLMSLLDAYKKQYYILKGSGIATTDIVSDFENIEEMATREAEVDTLNY